MAKTVVGLFDNRDDAQTVIQELLRVGFNRNNIGIFANEGQNTPQAAALNALVRMGVPQQDAQFYAEGARRGGTLVMVSAPDNQAETAYEIIQRYGAVDLDQRMAQWQQSGPATQTTSQNQGEAVLPVVEEQLEVGKRPVQRGGMRAYTTVKEIPVEEQVMLREEHVNVQRRPVDRPISQADINAVREGAIEVTTMGEEAVVSKQARVVEEVVIDKEVQQRNQTVRDNVRRTDVEVEQLDSDTSRRAETERDYRNI